MRKLRIRTVVVPIILYFLGNLKRKFQSLIENLPLNVFVVDAEKAYNIFVLIKFKIFGGNSI